MNNRLLILMLSLLSYMAKAQTIAISNARQNIIYIGIDNPLNAVAENMKCGSFFLTTDNGTIKGESCHFRIHPKNVGLATIYIQKIKKKDTVLIGKKVFRVKSLPKPTTRIAGKKSGMINKKVLAAQTGIKASLENFDINIFYPIHSFSVIVVNDQDSCFFNNIDGQKFTQEMKQAFLKLKQNDRVYFIDIIAVLPNKKTVELYPIKFIIK
ncbi:MAG: GldM family protein [Bacteroidota bacterium]